ncbi:uncharacterized protein LOC115242773 [Formica exsecta]|uniref:uncharacterized protein LOC115242773 n=1 Tax=Formica exsecta TaxID=72781 RepID=UPI00114293A8|nr:uncharacterized protein LOC115242773 [Formica exsecta]
MDIQHQSAIDVQQSTLDNHDNSTIQHDNLILAKPIVVENTVTHNNISRKRKQCNNTEQIFLKTGKYNIECIRKTEFATNQAWSKFVKYVNYNRYLHKLSVTRKSRVQKKIETLQKDSSYLLKSVEGSCNVSPLCQTNGLPLVGILSK